MSTFVGSESDPAIHVTAVVVGDQWELRFACPWCPPRRGKPIVHTHPGGPITGEPAWGWRVSHCPRRGQTGVPDAYVMVVQEPPAPCTVTWSPRARFWNVVVVRCPYCGKRHFHGGGSESEPDLGFRLAHCDHPGSYRLEETAASLAQRQGCQP